jgi:hypothetical protein
VAGTAPWSWMICAGHTEISKSPSPNCPTETTPEMGSIQELLMARVAIYVRVSTVGQTTENQLRELRAVAKREGHKIVAESRTTASVVPRAARRAPV